MSSAVRTDFDARADVLYAKLVEGRIVDSREAEHDSMLILNFGPSGSVVGVQILEAAELPLSVWQEHPDRHEVPDELATAVDAWLEAFRPR